MSETHDLEARLKTAVDRRQRAIAAQAPTHMDGESEDFGQLDKQKLLVSGYVDRSCAYP